MLPRGTPPLHRVGAGAPRTASPAELPPSRDHTTFSLRYSPVSLDGSSFSDARVPLRLSLSPKQREVELASLEREIDRLRAAHHELEVAQAESGLHEKAIARLCDEAGAEESCRARRRRGLVRRSAAVGVQCMWRAWKARREVVRMRAERHDHHHNHHHHHWSLEASSSDEDEDEGGAGGDRGDGATGSVAVDDLNRGKEMEEEEEEGDAMEVAEVEEELVRRGARRTLRMLDAKEGCDALAARRARAKEAYDAAAAADRDMRGVGSGGSSSSSSSNARGNGSGIGSGRGSGGILGAVSPVDDDDLAMLARADTEIAAARRFRLHSPMWQHMMASSPTEPDEQGESGVGAGGKVKDSPPPLGNPAHPSLPQPVASRLNRHTGTRLSQTVAPAMKRAPETRGSGGGSDPPPPSPGMRDQKATSDRDAHNITVDVFVQLMQDNPRTTIDEVHSMTGGGGTGGGAR